VAIRPERPTPSVITVSHEAWPGVQLSVQVGEHAAFGAIPEQALGNTQFCVGVAAQHPFASFAQVATVWLSRQMLPTPLHTLALHSHDAVVPEDVHVWLGPHVVLVTHCVQPFA
jgi:hypothetical protein